MGKLKQSDVKSLIKEVTELKGDRPGFVPDVWAPDSEF